MAEDLVSTDEAILDSIGEGDESTTDESVGEESTGTATDTTKAASPANSEQGAADSTGTERPTRTSGPQDLVDRNGNVIAAGGKERRFYETAHREKNRADQATSKVAELTAQLEAINNAGTVGTQYDLSPEEVSTGAQLIAAWKKNPVETVQYMLTQAQSMGHNVDAIMGGGTDMGAVKQMLDSALAPLIGERQARQAQEEVYNRATEIYNEFSGRHPDAAVHEDSLARLLQNDPSLTPEAAYYKLQSWYAQTGLDWTKSLATLQQEAQAARPSVNTQPQPPEGGGVSPSNVTDTARVADVSTSTDDIIRQAMAEAGITN